MKKNYDCILTIAGSDSCAGAGIQADIKTFAALGCYGICVITAITAQNTQGVSGVYPVPAEFVGKQIDSVLKDIRADVVKIGMTYSVELIELIALKLREYEIDKIVLDPVMVAQSGDRLLQDKAIDAICKHLMPVATIVTPNLPEASVIASLKVNDLEDAKQAAKLIANFGSQNILIKGGHLNGEKSTDILYISKEDRIVLFEGDRINTKNNHGTGCTLSSAIASYLAKGLHIEKAVKNAKIYINDALQSGAEYQFGHGHGPVNHFFKFWD